ncbi:VanZ family protein [Desulfogranum mediterraneum]|uniref:VanZ family protein n=1 Tax=Desulfogranum mediterraneum TaxID=160661 RepID=UPI000412E544|nr:VanZ family protein [Desulfogranum mediterraneum]
MSLPPPKKLLRLIPVAMVMGIIFYLSHQPGHSFDLPRVVNLDKLLHTMVYTCLGLAAGYALPPEFRRRHPSGVMVGLVLFCLCYGLSDEFHQSFIPGREPSVGDLLADTLGGCIAVASLRLHEFCRPRPAAAGDGKTGLSGR